MVNKNQVLEPRLSNIPGILLGTLVGGLAGALTMLVLAPQSGKEARAQLQKKGGELRDQTAAMAHAAVEKIHSDGTELVVEGRHKVQDFAHQGKMLVARQVGQVSKAAAATQKAIQEA